MSILVEDLSKSLVTFNALNHILIELKAACLIVLVGG